jgi:serine/threonine protein kinase
MYVWRRLRHPNIAEFFGVALQFDVRPCIVMKWYKNGTAREYLKTHPEYRMVMVGILHLLSSLGNGVLRSGADRSEISH